MYNNDLESIIDYVNDRLSELDKLYNSYTSSKINYSEGAVVTLVNTETYLKNILFKLEKLKKNK